MGWILLSFLYWMLHFVIINVQGCDLSRESEHCTTNSNGVKKCFYLCNEEKTWNEAKSYCEGNGGHLVADNGTGPFENVMELLEQGLVDEAWTSGRSGPRYWNWGEGSGLPAPLYYQGCYRTHWAPNNDAEMNFDLGLIGIKGAASCRQGCLEKKFKFYTLRDIRGTFKCYCGNSFGRLGLSTSCKKNCVDFHNCGTNHSSAVYSVNKGADVIWSEGSPESPSTPRGQGLCIQGQSRRRQNVLHVTVNSASCDREFSPICVTETPCNAEEAVSLNREAICYKVMSLPVNWATAVHICQDYDKSRASHILSLHKDAIREDLQQILRNEVDFWTGGSSFVWAWHQGNNQVDIKQLRWNVKLPHFPQPNKCAVIHKSGNLISRDCETYKVPFICEKVDPAKDTKATTPEDRVSTPEHTTPGANPVEQTSVVNINTYIIIGAVAAGVIILLLIICLIVMYLTSRRKAKRRAPEGAPVPFIIGNNPQNMDQFRMSQSTLNNTYDYPTAMYGPGGFEETSSWQRPQHKRLPHMATMFTPPGLKGGSPEAYAQNEISEINPEDLYAKPDLSKKTRRKEVNIENSSSSSGRDVIDDVSKVNSSGVDARNVNVFQEEAQAANSTVNESVFDRWLNSVDPKYTGSDKASEVQDDDLYY